MSEFKDQDRVSTIPAFVTESEKSQMMSDLEKFTKKNKIDPATKNWLTETISGIISLDFREKKENDFTSTGLIQDLAYGYYQRMKETSQDNSQAEDSKRIKSLVDFVRYLAEANQIETPPFKLLRALCNSARAQAGLMFGLENRGFVLVPREKGKNRGRMDYFGIDFVAVDIKKDSYNLYFIDAKAVYNPWVLNPEFIVLPPRRDSLIDRRLGFIFNHLKEGYPQLNWPDKSISTCLMEIKVPTEESCMDRYGRMVPRVLEQVVEHLKGQEMRLWI